ncbi:MAG TPA: hypothetical protein VEL77_09970, partial [Rugosimonospora sp.]|nr:hypothetical protein [Rugosimonospora sp.]
QNGKTSGVGFQISGLGFNFHGNACSKTSKSCAKTTQQNACQNSTCRTDGTIYQEVYTEKGIMSTGNPSHSAASHENSANCKNGKPFGSDMGGLRQQHLFAPVDPRQPRYAFRP